MSSTKIILPLKGSMSCFKVKGRDKIFMLFNVINKIQEYTI